MSPFLFSVLASVMTVLIWGVYFYGQSGRHLGDKEVMKVFSLGALSIGPVLLFHQWLLAKVVIHLKEIWPSLDIPIVSAMLELCLLLLFIFFFIAIFSFLHSLMLRIFFQLPWKQSFKTIYNRIYNLTPILIFFILFLAIEIIFNLSIQISFILSLGGSTVVFAVLEEYFKFLINPFLVYKKINSINTAMVYAIYIGLAFAFIENLLFFYTQLGAKNFIAIVIYRCLFTTILHIGASGLLGYFYGLSLFAESMLTNYEIEKSRYYLPGWLEGMVKKTAAFKSISVTQGFVLVALVHALFNLLLYLNMVIFAAIVATCLMAVTIFLLHSKSTKVQYGLIGSKIMPSADFEKLRLQISVLEHVREIQKERVSSG